MATRTAPAATLRALQTELADMTRCPIEGFEVKLVDDSNLFEWDVAMYGPPETIYEGGYLKANIKFPEDYPFSPPKMMFKTEMWHPNIFYPQGEVCISILHSPTNDPMSGERPEERWNPTQNVRTILISVVSMLCEPNVNSPANVDASIMYRRHPTDYKTRVRALVEKSKAEAQREGIVVPSTIEEYTKRTQVHRPQADIDSYEMLQDSDDNFDYDEGFGEDDFDD